MTYVIITTCFVRVENFNSKLYFMFSAVMVAVQILCWLDFCRTSSSIASKDIS